MRTIIIKNQNEFNAIDSDFQGIIEIRNDFRNVIYVNRTFRNSSVVAWGNSSVVAWENSSVEARENSSVVAWENSSVVAWENSSVEARENSSVVAWENSSVVAWENSSVVAWENSSVEAWGNSSVVAWGNSSVVARENSSVNLCGWSQARIMSRYATYTILNNARVILPLSGIQDYIDYFGIKESEDTITMYKAVRKNDEKENVFHADYDNNFKYYVGKKSTEKRCDTDITKDCGVGIHISHMQWALNFGRNWDDLAIIECEVPKDKCVVYEFSDGKIRTSELKVIREVPRSEWGVYGKIIK